MQDKYDKGHFISNERIKIRFATKKSQFVTKINTKSDVKKRRFCHDLISDATFFVSNRDTAFIGRLENYA